MSAEKLINAIVALKTELETLGVKSEVSIQLGDYMDVERLAFSLGKMLAREDFTYVRTWNVLKINGVYITGKE